MSMRNNATQISWIVVAALMTLVASADQPRSWVPRDFAETAPRREAAAMVYDSVRDVIVYFGGYERENESFNDTWEWDGYIWRKAAIDGPSPRGYAAMAFDEARGVTILFGGMRQVRIGQQYYYGDTWQWDGITWTQIDADGPSARRDATMVYDAARQRCVLFGGREKPNSIFAETWEWDGTSWTNVSQDGPDPRWGHTAAYDTQHQRTLILGGRGRIGYREEMWSWDGDSWTQLEDPPLGWLVHAAAAFDSARDKLVVHAGTHYRASTWEWDGTSWEKLAESDILPWVGHSLIFNPRRGRCMLYGGVKIGPLLPEIWQWDGSEWNHAGSVAPNSRAQGRMDYDPETGTSALFGGLLGEPLGGLDSNIYLWNGERWTLHRPAKRPYLVGHGFVNVSKQGVFLAVGGDESHNFAEDTFLWNGETWAFEKDHAPDDRCQNGVAYDQARDRVVMFGGGSFDETWEWDGSTWTEIAVSGPSARCEPAMIFDARRGVCVLFGGTNDEKTGFGDTWEYDGEQWLHVSDDGPTPRFGAQFIYDSKRGVVVLTGGWGVSGARYAALSDVWTWDGTTWERLNDAPMPGRLRHAVSYDSRRDAIVVVAGASKNNTSSQLSDCWEYAPDPLPGDANCDAAIDFDDIDFFVAALANDFSGYLRAGGLRSCWARRVAWGDFSHDGEVNFADIDGFISALIRN